MILLSQIKVVALSYVCAVVGYWLAIRSTRAIKEELARWEAMQ